MFESFEIEEKKLPNATPVLVLGIISILTCCCYGIPGIICGIIALVLFQKDQKEYNLNPKVYTNYSSLNTGRILAIIGIVFSVAYLLLIILMVAFLGWDAMQNPELMQERMNDLMN